MDRFDYKKNVRPEEEWERRRARDERAAMLILFVLFVLGVVGLIATVVGITLALLT